MFPSSVMHKFLNPELEPFSIPTQDRLDVRLDGEMLEEVESFKYFGSHVAVHGRVTVEVGQRVEEASMNG